VLFLTVSYTLIECSIGICAEVYPVILLIPNHPFGLISSWCPLRGHVHLTSWKYDFIMFLLLGNNYLGSPNTSLKFLKIYSEALSDYPLINV